MWRDDRIQAAIDTTTGFIAAKLAERLHRPLHEMERLFLASKTYGMLCDPETGLYADNVLVTADLFLREAAPDLYTQEELTAQPYFKYRSLTDPHTEDIFKKKELWYAAPSSFNDPFDCNLQLNCDGSSDEEIERCLADMAGKRWQELSEVDRRRALDNARKGQTDIFSKMRKQIYDDSSVCCFSRLGDSIQMFSYYADGHKGICIEFSFSILDMPCGYGLAQQMFVRGKIIPFGVVCSDEFPELNINRLVLNHDPKALARNLIGVKAKQWEHEEEYRIFRDQIPAGPVPFAPQILKRVILGAKTDDDKMALVKGWLKDWPTPVILSKAEADTKSFTLNIRDVETVGRPRT